VTPSARDHERVRELLGRTPRGAFEVVVRDDSDDPVVLRNEPLLEDGTPMPTRFWLVGESESRRIGQLESTGGVAAAEAAVDADALADAHRRYADERDAAIPEDHDGPRPTGGVGGTRVGVKCLHAHWAWHLAGGDDPVGRWIEAQFTPAPPREPASADTPGIDTCEVAVAAETTVVRHGTHVHEIPWGRLDPDVVDAGSWTFAGPTITSLASLEAGCRVPAGPVDYPRSVAEEVFRLVATESTRDRAENPGLPSDHVEYIVATSCIVQACMRHLHLDSVTLRAAADD